MAGRPFRFAVPAAAAAVLASAALVPPARAQLIREEARGEQRVCTYAGSDVLPDDTVAARSVIVGIGQGCPATAPYRDPNAPVPPNAALVGEVTTEAGRVCRYSQGGITYQRAIPLAALCAVTPALLDRQLAGAPAGGAGTP